MKRAPLAILLTGCVLCCGCSASKPAPEIPATGPVSTAAVTELTDIPVLTEPSVNKQAAPEETPSVTPEEPAVIMPAPEVEQPAYRGGDGGEEHAQTPLPEYFTYRFYGNGLSARLAGGLYQALELDLSSVSPLDAETRFYLKDTDLDGDLDLSVPVLYTDVQKIYAVFFWNAESAHYSESPLMLSNPQYFDADRHLTTLEQTASSAAVTDFLRENGTLTAVLTASCDPEMLTMTVSGTDANGEPVSETESAPDSDALTEMLLQFYHRQSAYQTTA